MVQVNPGANPGKALISTALKPVWKSIFFLNKRNERGEHIVHIMGRGAERRQWRMKRRRKRSEQQVQAPLQGVCTPIANLTERAK
jgi:hypothetical protein